MSRLRKNTGRTFRFPFDIDRRVFLLLAAIFFVLSIKNVNTFLWPRLTEDTIELKINAHFDDQFERFEKIVQKLSNDDISFQAINNKKLELLNKLSWSYLVYKQDSLIFWSKRFNQQEDLNGIQPDSLYTYKNSSETGIIIKKNKEINGEPVEIIGRFPVYVHYNLENKFFNSFFCFLNTSGNEQEDFGYRLQPISAHPSGEKIIKIKNTPRFELVEGPNFLELTDNNFWRFFLAAIPFIMFGVSIHTFFKVSVKDNPPLYFSLLLLTVFVIRGLGYFKDFPDGFTEFLLFNPSLYAAGGLNTSLGDVFINACLLFWILFFFIMNVQNKVFNLRKQIYRLLFITFCSLLLLVFAYLTVSNIRSIINDGLLNFDTTNYDNINSETIIGLGTLLLIFMNYVLGIIIFNRYFERYFKKSSAKYLVPLLGILLSYLLIDPSLMVIMTIICCWTSLTLLFFSIKFLSTKFDFNSYKLIYWLIYLSGSCVLTIYYFDSEKEIKVRQNFAESLIRFENKETEKGLLELGNKIKQDSVLAKLNKKYLIQEYLNQNYVVRFGSEYSTQTKVYHFRENADKNDPGHIYITRNTKIIQDQEPAIYLTDKAGEEEYIFSQRIGNFQIVLKLSPSYDLNWSSNAFLTRELGVSLNNIYPKYSFGYYLNDKLVQQSGIEAFPSELPAKANQRTGRINLDNNLSTSDVIVHSKEGDNIKSVVIRKKSNMAYKLSTTYAYIFTSIFLLMSLYILGNIIARSNLRRKRFVNLLGLTLRMRIHLSILLVELISLSIIGTITILVLSSSAKQSAIHKASVAAREIKIAIQQAEQTDAYAFQNRDSINTPMFNELISPYLEKHGVGLNLYGLDGRRIYSTISSKISSITPNLISTPAFSKLKRNSNVSTLRNEQIGNLDYYTIYSNLRNRAGHLMGILEIPNFSSKQTIRQNNSNIVTMLINIYAFVFLLSSLFAFYITKRLTNSFSKIVTQFSKINLTQTNEPLQWPYSDEIGLLIKEYNRTLVKLENSTALLAKSEREIAWREMVPTDCP